MPVDLTPLQIQRLAPPHPAGDAQVDHKAGRRVGLRQQVGFLVAGQDGDLAVRLRGPLHALGGIRGDESPPDRPSVAGAQGHDVFSERRVAVFLAPQMIPVRLDAGAGDAAGVGLLAEELDPALRDVPVVAALAPALVAGQERFDQGFEVDPLDRFRLALRRVSTGTDADQVRRRPRPLRSFGESGYKGRRAFHPRGLPMAKTLIWAVALIVSAGLLLLSPSPAQAQLSRLPRPPLSTEPVEPEQEPDPEHGRIPIYGQVTIAKPGSYFLARSFISSGVAIRIESDDVTLDLNGNTIARSYFPNPDQFPCLGPIIAVIGSRVTVRDGSLVPEDADSIFCEGIYAIGDHIRIARVNVIGATGFRVIGAFGNPSEYVEIVDCSFKDSYDLVTGINVFARNGRFIGNVIHAEDGIGMQLKVSNAEIFSNKLTGREGRAIRVEGSANTIRGNAVEWTGAGGEPGIDIISGTVNLVEKNVLNGAGIRSQGSGNRIVGNVIRNAAWGVSVQGSNDYIEDNFISDGYVCAIEFTNGNGHLFGGNIAANSVSCPPPAGNIDLGGNHGL